MLERIALVRAHASAMGIARSPEEVRGMRMIPMVALVSEPGPAATLDGWALPLTGSLRVAVACGIAGSLPNRLVREGAVGSLRLGMPSGVIQVSAEVRPEAGGWHAVRGSFYRTTRRLFAGTVYA